MLHERMYGMECRYGFDYVHNQSGEIIATNTINLQSNWNLDYPTQTRSVNGLNQYIGH
jgi:hypothetical protein